MTLHENQAKNIQKNDYEKSAAAPPKNIVDAAIQSLNFRLLLLREVSGLVKLKVPNEKIFKFKYIYSNKASRLQHKQTAQPNATSKFKQLSLWQAIR